MSERILIFGGTGSLGKELLEEFLKNKTNRIAVFSRDEAKHVVIKQRFPEVESIMGDIRDFDAVKSAIRKFKPTQIINASALKNIPECEFFPIEALKTNTLGAINVVQAVEEIENPIKCLFISTDKACHPANAYAMSKAMAERIHLKGASPHIFNVCRYGNVLNSRGSVIPFFMQRIKENKKLLITDPRMTRFFMSMSDAVDLIKFSLTDDEGGKIFIPEIKSAKIITLARVLLKYYFKGSDENLEEVGIRPGEKLHETLVSEQEWHYTHNCTASGFEYPHLYITDSTKNYKNSHHPLVDEKQLRYSSDSKERIMEEDELLVFLKEKGIVQE